MSRSTLAIQVSKWGPDTWSGPRVHWRFGGAWPVSVCRVPLPDGRQAQVTARRRPGTGELNWVVRVPGAAAVDDDQVARAIHQVRVLHGL